MCDDHQHSAAEAAWSAPRAATVTTMIAQARDGQCRHQRRRERPEPDEGGQRLVHVRQRRDHHSASGQTLAFSATGLPAGLSIRTSGLLSGTPTTAATSNVTVTATDTSGAKGSASFTWTIGSTAPSYIGVSGGATASTWTSSGGWAQQTVSSTTGSSGTVTVFVHGWYGQGNVDADDFSLR